MTTTKLVSICTPTYNRRNRLKNTIKYVENQTFPHDRIEWLIYDDGEDKIEDLVESIPYVRYFESGVKRSLGYKRNFLNRKARGDIIVYMDDDDIYPKERVEHAVSELEKNPEILCAGATLLFMYFEKFDSVWRFGPYGQYHSTAASLAFRKELLETCHFEKEKGFAEEKYFLKGYTIPMIQLDPFKTILAVSHLENTVDKNKLIEGDNAKYSRALPCDNNVLHKFIV
jgi:GT2 family glycosyltransferase